MPDQELSSAVQRSLVDSNGSIKGWDIVGVTPVMATRDVPIRLDPTDPKSPQTGVQKQEYDTGMRQIVVSNPTGAATSAGFVSKIIVMRGGDLRDSNDLTSHTGDWTTQTPPDDTHPLPPGATNPYPGGVHANAKGQVIGVGADGKPVVIDDSTTASSDNPYPGGVHLNGKGQVIGIDSTGKAIVVDDSTNNPPNPYPGGVHVTADGEIVGVDATGKAVSVRPADPSLKNLYPGGIQRTADGRLLGIKADGTTTVIDATTTPKEPPNPYPGGVHPGPNGSLIGVKADGSSVTINQGQSGRHNITTTDGSIISVSDTDPKDQIDTGLKGDSAGLVMVGDANSKQWSFIDKSTGNVVKTLDNPQWKPAPPQELTPNTVAPFIHQLVTDPVTGEQSIKSVPNDNQLTVTQAMMEVLYPQLAKAMTDGTMNADTAKALMTAASNKAKDEIAATTNQIRAAEGGTTAANDTLTQLNQGATTGAGLLKDRVDQTQGSLNSWIGAAGANKNLGLGSQLGPNFGSNLVNGIGDWATQMGGGQGVYDAAAAAVKAINPDDPHAAPSYATLAQMQQKFKELTGISHPTEQQTTQTGLATPQAPSLTPTWQRADTANTPPGPNGLATPGAAGTVSPDSPNAMYFKPPPVGAVQQMQTPRFDQTLIRGFR